MRLSISAWCCDESVQLRVLERHHGLHGQRPRSLDLAGVECVRDDHEVAEVGGSGAQWERDALAGCFGLAGARDLAVPADHDPAHSTGRLDCRLDHDAQQLARIVRRDERLAEPLGRLPDPGALGLDVEALLLELARHVVEGDRELSELVAPAHVHPLAQVPVGDRAGGVGEPPQACRRPTCRGGT